MTGEEGVPKSVGLIKRQEPEKVGKTSTRSGAGYEDISSSSGSE